MTDAEDLDRLLACEPGLRIAESPLFTDEPKLAVYSARLSEGGRIMGHGVDTSGERARLKAAAEALGRSCLDPPAAESLVSARYGDLDGQVDPVEFWGGEGEGLREAGVAPERLRTTARPWIAAIRLDDRSDALLPAEMVYLGLSAKLEAPIRREGVSTGAALGWAGAGQAEERGLFEVIERDALMAVWLGVRPAHRITDVGGALAPLCELLRRYRLEPLLFDMGCELGPPAVLAIALDRSGVGPAVTAGVAARATYELACRSALLEAVGSRRGIRLAMARGTWPTAGPAEAIGSFKARAAFWTPLASLRLLPAWVEQSPAKPWDALQAVRCDAARALGELGRRGLAAYRCELTSPAPQACGYEVQRVVVPRLHPLHIAEPAMARRSWRGGFAARAQAPPHPFL